MCSQSLLLKEKHSQPAPRETGLAAGSRPPPLPYSPCSHLLFPMTLPCEGMEPCPPSPRARVETPSCRELSGSPCQGVPCPFLVRLQSCDADPNRKPGRAGTSAPCFTTGRRKEAPCFHTLPPLFHAGSPPARLAAHHFKEPSKSFLKSVTTYFSISTDGNDCFLRGTRSSASLQPCKGSCRVLAWWVGSASHGGSPVRPRFPNASSD